MRLHQTEDSPKMPENDFYKSVPKGSPYRIRRYQTSFETEREGFEPSIELPLYSISSAAPSTTRPPLQRL